MPTTKFGEILDVIKSHEIFSISSHISPDGDAIGSQIAVYSLISELGKKAYIINRDLVPITYSFMPKVDAFKSGGTEIFYLENADVSIILDCANLGRTGEKLASLIHPKYALINIDHHLKNTHFGTHNLVDENACATAELVFNLLKYNGIRIGYERAVCLYAAILTDTGSFRYQNTNSETHRIAAQLIDEGIKPDIIAEMIYASIPYPRTRLFGLALKSMQITKDGKVAWVSVTRDMFEETGTESADTEEFVDYVRSVRDIRLAILFRENEDGSIKVSLRSKGDSNSGFTVFVDQIASAFGGGGHKMAAGCVLLGPLSKAIDIILHKYYELDIVRNKN